MWKILIRMEFMISGTNVQLIIVFSKKSEKIPISALRQQHLFQLMPLLVKQLRRTQPVQDKAY